MMVNSQAKQQALSRGKPLEVWIGLHRDPKDNSTWLWVDGSRATFTNWNKHEPNNLNGSEDCVNIFPWENWEWNDRRCADSLRYVCETTGKT